MRTIAVIARKGGSGKTTIATHVAIAAHNRGLKTLVADTDPQRSAIEVLKARRGDGPERMDSSGPKLFALQVAAMRQGPDAMVIDTPAGSEEEVAHAIVLADLSLLILRPTFLDLAAAVRTVDVVRRLRKPAMIVLNQAPAPRGGQEPPSVRKALQALRLMRLPVAPTIIRARSSYQSALETGRSAEELSFDPAAAQEVREFWRYLERFAFSRGDVPPAPAASPKPAIPETPSLFAAAE